MESLFELLALNYYYLLILIPARTGYIDRSSHKLAPARILLAS